MTDNNLIDVMIESQGLVAHFDLKIIQPSDDENENKEGFVRLEFTQTGISPISEDLVAFSQIEQYEIHGKIAQMVKGDIAPMLEGMTLDL